MSPQEIISGKKLKSALWGLSLVLFCLGFIAAQGIGADFRVITVKEGDSLSYLCFKVYKKYDDSIAARIKEHNPGIGNIDSMQVGQKIRFPKSGLLGAENALPKVSQPANRLQPEDAHLTYLSGDAEVRRLHAQKWEPVRVNAKLKQGDRIRIGNKSKAEIITFDGDIIRLAQNSELTISYLKKNPLKNIKKKRLFLRIGRMWNKTKRLRRSESEYIVKTPNAISGIWGTTYNIDVSPQQTTRIKTFSGSVKIWRFPSQRSDKEDWKITEPVPIQGPQPVTMEEWTGIILKLHEELSITRQGAATRAFDPEYDEIHDDWIKWNKMRDKAFDSFKTWD